MGADRDLPQPLAALWRGCASVGNDKGEAAYLTDVYCEAPCPVETNLNLRELLYYRIGFV